MILASVCVFIAIMFWTIFVWIWKLLFYKPSRTEPPHSYSIGFHLSQKAQHSIIPSLGLIFTSFLIVLLTLSTLLSQPDVLESPEAIPVLVFVGTSFFTVLYIIRLPRGMS